MFRVHDIFSNFYVLLSVFTQLRKTDLNFFTRVPVSTLIDLAFFRKNHSVCQKYTQKLADRPSIHIITVINNNALTCPI